MRVRDDSYWAAGNGGRKNKNNFRAGLNGALSPRVRFSFSLPDDPAAGHLYAACGTELRGVPRARVIAF